MAHDALHLVQPVTGEHQGHALLGQPGEEAQHLAHAHRVQAGQGLVQDQQFGTAQQGPGDGQPAGLAQGEAAGPLPGALVQAHQAQGLVGVAAGAVAQQAPAVLQVLADAETGDQGGLVEDDGHPAPGAMDGPGRLAQDLHLPGGRPQQAEGAGQGGGLPRAIGPEQPEQLALLHGQGDVLERLGAPVPLGEAVDPQDAHGRAG